MYKVSRKWFIFALISAAVALILTQNISITLSVFALCLMPDFIRLYFSYAKDNPNKFWYKRKLYGWGWTPVTWQGWLLTIIYVALVAFFAQTIDENSPPKEIAFTFILPVTFLTITFFRIAILKGEKPKWQWGREK